MDKLASTKELRRELKPNDYVIPSAPAKLPPDKYHLFNRLLGTIAWTELKCDTMLDVSRTLYEAIYPYLDMLSNDNEALLHDNNVMLRTNAEFICYIKEKNQWEDFQSYLKNTSSQKSEDTSTSNQKPITSLKKRKASEESQTL